MRIAFIEIQNFRKLKSCRIDFSEKQTIFVGANNSGKTSAMDALILFLKNHSGFKTQDFTLSNWNILNKIGEEWINTKEDDTPDYKLMELKKALPRLDVWLDVEKDEVHYVSHLIPTLGWTAGLLGIRLEYEPKDVEELYKDFKDSVANTEKIKKGQTIELWPKDFWDFLDGQNKLNAHFSINAYVLDPSKTSKIADPAFPPQTLDSEDMPLENSNPLQGLIKIDIINAQRGFDDPNGADNTQNKLSSQLKEYYDKHLDPTREPSEQDIAALKHIENAKKAFDENLVTNFKNPLQELEGLNYPGFGNPSIRISSKFNPISGLDHDSSVRFSLPQEEGGQPLSLPEKYNGLGYQNLISMVFRLIRFRDSWMRVGKVKNEDGLTFIEPLHLVLLEEPEAHLHAQAQQIFIQKAYDILRAYKELGDSTKLRTQLAVSTHSSHIAHETDFTNLRYFKRVFTAKSKMIPTSEVVNLSKTFGEESDTAKFAARYLKTTHCDLFFADAAILVEGSAERMLVPHFIKNNYERLSISYISILEIGGSHAQKLEPLINDLGIATLIITDIDTVDPAKRNSSVFPEKDKGYVTWNSTIRKWLPKINEFDSLIDLETEKKISENTQIRIAYQTAIKIGKEEIFPYTFEDSLAFSNMEFFKALDGNGLIRKIREGFNTTDSLKDKSKKLYEDIEGGSRLKAGFALELLFLKDPKGLAVPAYMDEGLKWLEAKLETK